MIIASLKKYGPSFPSFILTCQLYIPCFAPWWLLFILKDYLNSPGKELLFVYTQSRDRIMVKLITLWFLYVLHVLIVFAAAAFIYDFVWFLFVAIIIQSLFLTALAYFIALLLQNTFIPLIINFAYSLIFMLAGGTFPLNIFSEGFRDASSLGKSVWVSIAAFILLYVGLQMEKHLYKNSI